MTFTLKIKTSWRNCYRTFKDTLKVKTSRRNYYRTFKDTLSPAFDNWTLKTISCTLNGVYNWTNDIYINKQHYFVTTCCVAFSWVNIRLHVVKINQLFKNSNTKNTQIQCINKIYQQQIQRCNCVWNWLNDKLYSPQYSCFDCISIK